MAFFTPSVLVTLPKCYSIQQSHTFTFEILNPWGMAVLVALDFFVSRFAPMKWNVFIGCRVSSLWFGYTFPASALQGPFCFKRLTILSFIAVQTLWTIFSTPDAGKGSVPSIEYLLEIHSVACSATFSGRMFSILSKRLSMLASFSSCWLSLWRTEMPRGNPVATIPVTGQLPIPSKIFPCHDNGQHTSIHRWRFKSEKKGPLNQILVEHYGSKR